MTATASSSRAVEVAARRRVPQRAGAHGLVVVVSAGGLGRGAVPDLPGRDHLPGVQRGGVPELGPVAEDGADVEECLLADEGAGADGDGTGLDDTGPRRGSR